MANMNEKLADALSSLKKLQDRGMVAIRTNDLTRTHRDRLITQGYLSQVIRGWYISTDPNASPGDTSAWYTSFWSFCADYLELRFNRDWCLSPEQSLLIHAGVSIIPNQLIVRSPKGSNNITNLLYDTSLLDISASIPPQHSTEVIDGLRVYSIAAALVNCTPTIFMRYPDEVRAVLSSLTDTSSLLELMLDGGQTVVAGRLAGALRNIGRARLADGLLETMHAAGHEVRENDPFSTPPPIFLSARERSPQIQRLKLMWERHRANVIEAFQDVPTQTLSLTDYLHQVEQKAVTDAYHSLSIEGYRVTTQLIERVRSGAWDPENEEMDRQRLAGFAARGYWEARKQVEKSIRQIFDKKNPGEVAREDHGVWHQNMFAPSVRAGSLKASDLAGYRSHPVYLRGSRYVPPRPQAVRDLMPAFFDLLSEESEPSVRVVLGHFIFVWIHPYADGNGRLGRFLMNLMMASGGYPWTVIPVQSRAEYMSALEAASVQNNITPIATFIARHVSD